MLRCQFLCCVLETFFIKIALKLSYFCEKCKSFERWGLRIQTPSLRQLGSSPIDPKISPPPIANFWLRAWFHFWLRPFYFAFHLICLPEKKGGRGSSPNVENRAKFE